MNFSGLPLFAVFGDGKEGVFLKVEPFAAAPQGFRSVPEANALQLSADPGTDDNVFSLAWFAADCDELVFPLPPSATTRILQRCRLNLESQRESVLRTELLLSKARC